MDKLLQTEAKVTKVPDDTYGGREREREREREVINQFDLLEKKPFRKYFQPAKRNII